MGRFLRRLRKAGKKLVGEDAVEKIENRISAKFDEAKEHLQETTKVDDLLQGSNVTEMLQKLQATAQKCHQEAQECREICETTQTQRQSMIDFGSTIQSSMESLSSAENSSENAQQILETIRDLTDGSKVEQAMELAQQVEAAATNCCAKSTQLIHTLDDGMDSLPPVVVKAMNQAFGIEDDDDSDGEDDDDNDDDDFEDHELTRSLEEDLADIQAVVDSIMDFNLANCLQVGYTAFESLTKRGEQSRALFDSIHSFSSDIDEIMDSFEKSLDGSATPDWNLLKSKASELWKCMQMTSQMKVVARAAGKLLEMIIKLFHATADRISVLWKALADAKDIMMESVDDITQAKEKCIAAKDRSISLVTKSKDLQERVRGAQTVNMESIQTLRDLSDGDEIQELVDLAQSMDDLAMDCSSKVTNMVEKVQSGFASIPPILTDGIVDLAHDGEEEDDPTPPDIGPDIEELRTSREAMDTADVLTVAKAGMSSFSLLEGKAGLCRDTLDLINSFASDCDGKISSFLNVWNMEVAQNKVKELCRLVSVGDMMQAFVQQIKEFALAMMDLLKSIITKFSSMDASMLADEVKEQVEDVKDHVEDKIDDVKDRIDDVKDQVDDLKDRFKNSTIGGLFGRR